MEYHFDTATYRYQASDTFTQCLLVSWCIQDVMLDQGLGHFQQLYTAYACSRHGYFLTRHCSAYEEIPKDYETILPQLFLTLKFLDDLEYSFSAPVAAAFGWLVGTHCVQLSRFDGKGHKTLILRIGNGCLTRVTDIGNVRLYDSANTHNHYRYNQYICKDFVQRYKSDSEFYRLSSDSIVEIQESQRAGYRFVGFCFDIYALIFVMDGHFRV